MVMWGGEDEMKGRHGLLTTIIYMWKCFLRDHRMDSGVVQNQMFWKASSHCWDDF